MNKLNSKANRQSIILAHHRDGGGSFALYGGIVDNVKGQNYITVGLSPADSIIKDGQIYPQDLSKLLAKLEKINNINIGLGTWYDSQEGRTYIDLIGFIPANKETDAVNLARLTNQKSIYNLKTGELLQIGGTGLVIPTLLPLDSIIGYVDSIVRA